MLIDGQGRPLGLLAAMPRAQNQNYAVPLNSLTGLIASVAIRRSTATGAAAYSESSEPLVPPSSLSVAHRSGPPLAAKGPGGVGKTPLPGEILLSSKTIFVESRTVNFKPDRLVNELGKKSQMSDWGLTFVDQRDAADLVLTLDHVLFTWKFTFKLVHQLTGVVVATGNVIIWDGDLGAPHMANRIIEKLTKVRGQ
jgi:hypothetical protein